MAGRRAGGAGLDPNLLHIDDPDEFRIKLNVPFDDPKAGRRGAKKRRLIRGSNHPHGLARSCYEVSGGNYFTHTGVKVYRRARAAARE